MSGDVALCLLWPGAVVTWFVTDLLGQHRLRAARARRVISPASAASVCRRRHLITVGSVQPARSAICAPVNPSAASSTVRARSTTRADALRRGAPLQLRPVSIGTRIRFGFQRRAAALAVGDLPGLRPGWRRAVVSRRIRR